LTRATTDFENPIAQLQIGIGDHVIDKRIGIVRTRFAVDARHLIKCKALPHEISLIELARKMSIRAILYAPQHDPCKAEGFP